MDDAKAIRILSPVLQKGFWHKAVTGVTIRKLLENQLRFTPDCNPSVTSGKFLGWIFFSRFMERWIRGLSHVDCPQRL